ncbi:hypothetical protein APUTEX25_002478 [Auxenochlorella protothecoides]|uniref:Uncharacterized protein n=1 Tax=Auxenochlorella protothecoides TaxID=3075 RepID=A0A3M7L0Q3_AUXPR|nr:hypothetical protein APUTEX25_002478 [Auxenochlorella protothecoides]|eukprot:RMZ56288.1 hypothetical protein APUTEX25_002478 [Auxenochlorella protothecoides]
MEGCYAGAWSRRNMYGGVARTILIPELRAWTQGGPAVGSIVGSVMGSVMGAIMRSIVGSIVGPFVGSVMRSMVGPIMRSVMGPMGFRTDGFLDVNSV